MAVVAHDARKLNTVGWRHGAAVADDGTQGGHATARCLVDGARDRGGHDGRVAAGRAARGHGCCSLAAVAAVAELVVVETACELRLLQVSSNVLVRHLLETSLEEIDFL